jgi:hypothetical protein
MSLIPHRFLFRLSYRCRYVKKMPLDDEESLLDLPPECRIDNYATIDGLTNFADFRMGWNESGIGIQVEVRGKDAPPQGSRDQPRGSDGLTVWIDTRGDRTSHRASRYCHQFHFLAAAGGSAKDEPVFVQTKINRALQDGPIAEVDEVPLHVEAVKDGYRLEAFLPASILNGFNPEDHPQLGFFYTVRDLELGEQTLSIGSDFPFADDPSLWSTIELAK